MYGSKSLFDRRIGVTWATLLVLGVVACDNPQPPAACGPLPQVTVNVGERTTVSACFNDPNGDVLTYTATSSNPGVATASISGTSVTVTAVAPGNASVTITAADPEGLQGQQSFQVMVPNRPPQPAGTIPSVSVPVGESTTVDASSYFTEPDGEVLTYGATSSNPAVATISVAGSTVTVTAVAKGTSNVTVTATDPGGLTATQTFRSTVPNRDPEPVGTIPDQTVDLGESVTVDLSPFFEDPDGDALTYTASSSNTRVARGSVSGSTLTVSTVAPGTATLTVTARDTDGASTAQRFDVTVRQPNRAPRAVGSIPAQSLGRGATSTIDASRYFTDPDGDALTYTARSSDSGVARVSVSGSTVTITAVANGSGTITVTARDPEGLTASQQAMVTVTQPNRAPQRVGSIPAQTVNPGSSATVDASRYFRDPDRDALTYTATSSNSGVARASVSGSTVTITAVAAGSATVTVTARDPGGLSATQTIRVTVGSAGAPDLEVPTVTPTSVTGSPGGSVMATFTVRNSGNATAAATTLRIYASSNATISTQDREIGNGRLPSLAAGRSEAVEMTVTLGNQTSGTSYFGICLDAVSGESDTQNNCSPGVRVTVGGSGGPDLVVSVSRSSVTVSPGDSFSYDVTIRNQGDARSAATRFRTFESNNSTITTTDREIGRGNVPALNPSEEGSGTLRIDIPQGTPAGTTYVGNCVDAVSGESNTDNNCSSAIEITIRTGAGSDTTYTTGQTIETLPTGTWFPNTLAGGASISISGGVVTVRFTGTSSYMIHNNIRYSCLTSTGCEIVNRRVTKGSIRARAESSGAVIAKSEGADAILHVIGFGEDPSPTSQPAGEAILRIRPGGESGADDTNRLRDTVIRATISAPRGNR